MIAIPITAQDTNPGPSLTELKTRFDESLALINQPLTALNQSYVEALKRLLATETEKGNLEGALPVKEEIERFGDGSDATAVITTQASSTHPSVSAMKSKYVSERARLWNAGTRSREELRRRYQAALTLAEKELIRLGRIEEAIEVRKINDDLVHDPRLASGDPSHPLTATFPARIHLVAKGEVELLHKGENLHYRNASPDRNKYVDGTSADFDLTIGDVIFVKMRATAVFRSFIMTIESKDKRLAIPVALDHYRSLGENADSSADADSIRELTAKPDPGTADPDMAGMWGRMPLSALSRSGSEWIKCGSGANWHTYAVVIESGMLQSVPPE